VAVDPPTRAEVLDVNFDLDSLGNRLVERTAGDVHAHALRLLVDEHVGRMPENVRAPMRDVVAIMADQMGHMMAALRVQGQAAELARRTREARLRVDPLPDILVKVGLALLQPDSIEVGVDDGAFVGFNWHRLEKNATQRWRWAYPALTGSIVLPRVRGSMMEVGIRFLLPFGAQANETTLTAMLDGVPIEFHDRQPSVWTGKVALPEDPAATRMALVIVSSGHSDPRIGTNRDTRILGIGLDTVWAKCLSR
jgi:hypothetical protein